MASTANDASCADVSGFGLVVPAMVDLADDPVHSFVVAEAL